jgi:glycine oxidase
MYPRLSKDLQDQTGIDNGFHVCGGIELPEDSLNPVAPTEEWAGEGADFTPCDENGLTKLEPGISLSFTKGAYLPGLAQVRNPRHLKALHQVCLQHGVEFYPNCPALHFQFGANRVLEVITAAGPMSAGKFLLTAGAWSETLLEKVGWKPGIAPIRGQMALLDTRKPGIRPILLQGKRYLVPRPDGKILVGSTEEQVGFAPWTTADAIGGLLAFAIKIAPELSEASVETAWAGLRPGTADGLPYLGFVPGMNNLLVAAGHFRSGIQLSPATGRLMVELILGRPLPIPLDDFSLDRIKGSTT